MGQLQIAHVCLTYEVSTAMFPRAFKINISSLRKLSNKGKISIVCCLVIESIHLLPLWHTGSHHVHFLIILFGPPVCLDVCLGDTIFG